MKDDVSSGCLLPLAQAVVSGLLAGALAYSAGRWFSLEHAHFMALTVGIGAGVLVWAGGLRRWQRAAYPEQAYPPVQTRAEEHQPTEPARVRLELSREDGRQMQLIDLPASLDQLTTLARGLLTGATLAESQWTGGGGLFTRAQFSALRAELIRRGLAAWNSPGTPARGAGLTRAGQAAMRHFASMTTDATPTPPGERHRR